MALEKIDSKPAEGESQGIFCWKSQGNHKYCFTEADDGYSPYNKVFKSAAISRI